MTAASRIESQSDQIRTVYKRSIICYMGEANSGATIEWFRINLDLMATNLHFAYAEAITTVRSTAPSGKLHVQRKEAFFYGL